MSRKRKAPKKIPIVDPVYKSSIIPKLINSIMYDGKRSTAERILYTALDKIKESKKEEFDWDDYEQKRAQAIVNNPGANNSEGENDVNDEGSNPVDDADAPPSALTEENKAVDKQPEQAESRTNDATSNDTSRTERDTGGQPGTPPLGDDTVYEIAKSTASMTIEPFDGRLAEDTVKAVSYTHLTLPTNREV